MDFTFHFRTCPYHSSRILSQSIGQLLPDLCCNRKTHRYPQPCSPCPMIWPRSLQLWALLLWKPSPLRFFTICRSHTATAAFSLAIAISSGLRSSPLQNEESNSYFGYSTRLERITSCSSCSILTSSQQPTTNCYGGGTRRKNIMAAIVPDNK